MKKRILLFLLFLLFLPQSLCAEISQNGEKHMTITKIESVPQQEWQKQATFPDWKGYTDDTLAMNSMISFKTWHDQGQLYLDVPVDATFHLNINGIPAEETTFSTGSYLVDFADIAINGTNTVQLGCILPESASITLSIPYPVILPGDAEAEGIRTETLRFLSDLIASDIEYGFTSAQLAIIRNGRLVFNEAFGKTNSYTPNGQKRTDSPDVTTDTLYDLASVTKMFATNYAIQKLVDEGRLDISTPIVDIFGDAFAEDVIRIDYDGCEPTTLDTQKAWKRSLTVRDILCHQAGFPADPQYHNLNFNAAKMSHSIFTKNVLFSGNDGSPETRAATLEANFRTPLRYAPGTKTLYSDVDYILLGFIVESITGLRLDQYLEETFYTPLELTHITYNPLDHGFAPEDCAATELNGNTRDHNISFPGIRTATVQGQVHDEKAWYAMGGISGHAGLFASAENLAKLASVMLTGGYGSHRFFSQNTIDLFTAPKSLDFGQWGLGWWREGDDQRPWYFGTQAAPNTIGHQGWTGTMVMVDPSRDLVIVYLTNKINSPVTSKDAPNRFNGNYYTASTLGFVPQILSIGMDMDTDMGSQLVDLLADMARESLHLIPDKARATHPAVLNAKSKIALLRKYDTYVPQDYSAWADMLEAQLP